MAAEGSQISQTTAEAAVIGEIIIMLYTQQGGSVLDVLTLHNSSHLFSVSCEVCAECCTVTTVYDVPVKLSQDLTAIIRPSRPCGRQASEHELQEGVWCIILHAPDCSGGLRWQSGST